MPQADTHADGCGKTPSTFQVMLHALKEFKTDEKGGTLRVEMPRAKTFQNAVLVEPWRWESRKSARVRTHRRRF